MIVGDVTKVKKIKKKKNKEEKRKVKLTVQKRKEFASIIVFQLFAAINTIYNHLSNNVLTLLVDGV